MKIAICSDLHLEFAPIVLKNEQNADVLILGGDICIATELMEYVCPSSPAHAFARKRSQMYHEFFQNCAKEFPNVIYVAGNHEHYHGDFQTTYEVLKERLRYIPNIYVLDKEIALIDGVMFIGSTLWTDMDGRDPITLIGVRDRMSDFTGCIKNSGKLSHKQFPDFKAMGITSKEFYELADRHGDFSKDKIRPDIIWTKHPADFTPQDSVDEHDRCLSYIKNMVAEPFDNDKFVVVGHHTPSYKSCAGKYGRNLLNGAYHTELFDFIFDRPQIKLWTHGHTHEDFDYMIGETRVVCNPRGYKGYEERAETFELKYVEI